MASGRMMPASALLSDLPTALANTLRKG